MTISTLYSGKTYTWKDGFYIETHPKPGLSEGDTTRVTSVISTDYSELSGVHLHIQLIHYIQTHSSYWLKHL